VAILPTVWTKFITNGVVNVFRVFPNGESTMVGLDNIYGDYEASRENDKISITIYSWPSQSRITSTSSRLNVTLSLSIANPNILSSTVFAEQFDEPEIHIDYTSLDASSRIRSLQSRIPRKIFQQNAIYNKMRKWHTVHLMVTTPLPSEKAMINVEFLMVAMMKYGVPF